MAHRAEYIYQLFTVDPLSGQLQTAGLQTLDVDLNIDEIVPSIDDVKDAAAKFRGERKLPFITSVRNCSKLGVRLSCVGCMLP